MIEKLVAFFTLVIQTLGYWGVFILMIMESMILPVPSEAVMPFAGFLVYQGVFGFWTIVIVSTLASIVGSLVGYYLGFFGGPALASKMTKWSLMQPKQVTWVHAYFKKKGPITVFICRFIPVVRHVISIPAGIARMDLKKFVFFTAVGACLWNSFLLYLGMRLAENWHMLTNYTKYLDILVLLVIAIYIIIHFHELLRGFLKKIILRKK